MTLKDNVLAETMMKETDSVSVKYHEFIQKVRIHGLDVNNSIFCFYEGNDDISYYPHRIKSWLKSKQVEKRVVSIGCKNKKNVTKLYAKIALDSWELFPSCLFFVDKDFTKTHNLPDKIYVTPGYSIENLFADVTVLESFLEEHIKISPYSLNHDLSDFNKLSEYFKHRLYDEVNDIVLLNAWYSIQINKRMLLESCGSNAYPDVKKLKKLSSIKNKLSSLGLTKINQDFLKDETENAYDATPIELDSEIKWLETDIIKNSRGKYIEEILYDIYKKIKEELSSPSELEISARPLKIEITRNSLKTHLNHHATTPNCLFQYLERRIYNSSE